MLAQRLAGKQVILASASPRRQELLRGLGVEYTLGKVKEYDESYPDNLETEQVPEFIACQKSAHYAGNISENQIVITADTIVILHGKIICKPHGNEEAAQMLRSLSGQTHTVITGVCIRDAHKQVSFSSKSLVTFDHLNDDEISWYIENYKPLDKAGAYGCHEWIGYVGIKKIEGSFYNVMGLPLQVLYRELLKF